MIQCPKNSITVLFLFYRRTYVFASNGTTPNEFTITGLNGNTNYTIEASLNTKFVGYVESLILIVQTDDGGMCLLVFYLLWIRGRVVRALRLGSKGPEFDPSVRPSVVIIANHC